jgi:hypothetical protein
MKTIEFLKTLQQPDGSFLGWPDGPVYAEITGYLIPTLMNWGKFEMAQRAADFLVSTQNFNGSWNGIDGATPTVFDTSACVEGLKYLDNHGRYRDNIIMAENWIRGMKLDQIYHVRTKGVIGYPFVGEIVVAEDTRTHYYAYALEGLFFMQRYNAIASGLTILKRGMQPRTMDGRGSDTCATAQVAYIRLLMDMEADAEIEAVNKLLNDDGSLPHDLHNPKKVAWACKYYLDMLYIKERGNG